MGRLLEVIHRVPETLAGQDDQVERVAEDAEDGDDRYEKLDNSRDVDVLRCRRPARSVQDFAHISLQFLTYTRPPRQSHIRDRRLPVPGVGCHFFVHAIVR